MKKILLRFFKKVMERYLDTHYVTEFKVMAKMAIKEHAT